MDMVVALTKKKQRATTQSILAEMTKSESQEAFCLLSSIW